jgi:hypothetical protein
MGALSSLLIQIASPLSFIAIAGASLEGERMAPPPEPSAYAKKFTGKYANGIMKGGVGHGQTSWPSRDGMLVSGHCNC